MACFWKAATPAGCPPFLNCRRPLQAAFFCLDDAFGGATLLAGVARLGFFPLHIKACLRWILVGFSPEIWRRIDQLNWEHVTFTDARMNKFTVTFIRREFSWFGSRSSAFRHNTTLVSRPGCILPLIQNIDGWMEGWKKADVGVPYQLDTKPSGICWQTLHKLPVYWLWGWGSRWKAEPFLLGPKRVGYQDPSNWNKKPPQSSPEVRFSHLEGASGLLSRIRPQLDPERVDLNPSSSDFYGNAQEFLLKLLRLPAADAFVALLHAYLRSTLGNENPLKDAGIVLRTPGSCCCSWSERLLS